MLWDSETREDRLKRKHLLIIAGAVVLVTAAVSTFTVRAKNRPDAQPPSPVLPTVAVARVEPAPIIQSLVLSGEFKPFQEVDVHAKVAGYIRQIYVDVGDKVKRGQTLAVLEVQELSAQLVAAHAAVRRAEDTIRRAQNEVARDKSSHQASHLDYNRLKQASLERPGLIAQQELDDAFAKDQSAEAQVDAAGASLSAAKNELGIAQADEKRLQAMADYTRIVSPFDGVVTKRYADTGALLQAGTASSTQAMPVVTIAEYEKLRLVLPVPEDAVPAVHLGSLVDVNVLALHRHFLGKVARFADALDLQTRTMHTEVDVDNPKGALVNGMYADVTLVLHEVKGALTVPIQAVTRNGNVATVLVMDAHDRIEPRQVHLGMEGPNRVEVVSGLDPSDRVVIGNPSDFHPGEKVQPKPFQEAAKNEEF